MKKIRFTKMHGIGNDYVYFTEMPCAEEDLPELSRKLSDRHCGVGGDGIILVLPSEVADFKMRIFNADGSEARMCGNGSRCVGKLVYDKGLTKSTTITLETLGGIKTLELHPGEDGLIDSVTVDMGQAVTSAPLHLQGHDVIPVDVGNPHGVEFIDCDPDDYPVLTLGPKLEFDPAWPDRANIEFAQITGPGRIKMRVWERGSGETMACGTGACAVAAAALATHRCGRDAVISLPGGDLSISLGSDGHVRMTGPAATAFEGSILI